MFALLKPHLSTLIEHFIFPLVCLTEDEIEMFNEDPAEYARQFFGGALPESSFISPNLEKGGLGTDQRTTCFREKTRLYRRLVRFSDRDRPRLPLDAGRNARKDFPPPPVAVYPIRRRQVSPTIRLRSLRRELAGSH